jgi:hypothetical protein
VNEFTKYKYAYKLVFVMFIQYFVLYGRKTWSPALKGERRLGMFENRMLRRILGPSRDEITGSGGEIREMRIFIT